MANHASITKIGEFITVLQSVESTNNYAMGMVHEGMAKHGDAWLALEQTAGKGQRGRSWKTTTGENILLSVVMEPAFMPVSRQFLFSMTIALACYDFFISYTHDEIAIKWPNDLYWRDRKAGGILIENVLKSGQWSFAVVGIGININQVVFPDTITNPVSLKQITGKTFDLYVVTRQLCQCIENRYTSLKNGDAKILEAYNEVLFRKGDQVRLKKDSIVFETRILGVDMEGRLLTSDTAERAFKSGHIEWLL